MRRSIMKGGTVENAAILAFESPASRFESGPYIVTVYKASVDIADYAFRVQRF